MNSLRNQPRPRSAGQSVVEFAIFVPILALVLLMAVDLGRVYLGWVDLTNVARVGANFAAQNPSAWEGSGDTAIQLRYRQLMAKDAQKINCTLPTTLPAPAFMDGTYTVGSRIRVSINCSFQLITPLLTNLIGDGAGHINVTSSAMFAVRFGSPNGDPIVGGTATASPSPTASHTASPTAGPTASPTAGPTASPTPTPAPTATAGSSSGPTATPGPSATPTAAPSATPTAQPLVVSFYGSPTSTDSSGGGLPGSTGENQIVGIPTLAITFHNTTTGTQGNCTWLFGDGGSSNACSGTVSHSYLTRGTYNVTLTVDSIAVARSSYVLVSCKVPAFAGVRKNSASATWTGAGFTAGNLTTLTGSGNYKIGYQSLAGGIVNPPGGCSGATISVGP